MSTITNYIVKEIETIKQININLLEDIKQLKMREAMLEYSAKTYKKLFNSHPDSIVLIRLSDGRILESNERFEKFLGYSKEEINAIGLQYFIADDLQRVKKNARNTPKNESYFQTQCTLTSRDNSLRQITVSASIIKHDNQTLIQARISSIPNI